MATLYSDIATKQASTDPKVLTSPQEANGRVRCVNGKITPGTESAGTIINLCKLPKGARILPSSKLYCEAGQNANITIKCGDSGDDDRYLVAQAIGASAVVIPLARGAGVGNTELTEESWIFLTTAVDALTAKYIGFEIFYVID
jgi:hypothetical protein